MLKDLPDGLYMRPANASDKPFLEKIYNASREDLRMANAEQDYIESIIDMQFRAQREGYGDLFPNAMYFIVEKHHEPVGKVTIDFGSNEVRLVDIAFLPQACGRGFGEGVIRSLQAAAEQTNAPLTLTVQQINIKAQRLYTRLGFIVEEVQPPYLFMAWYSKKLTAMITNPIAPMA